jgi:hypothetical protein
MEREEKIDNEGGGQLSVALVGCVFSALSVAY